MRCPACGAHFSPPAEICPRCRFDLRLGARQRRPWPKWLKIPSPIRRPLKLACTAGLVLALFAAVLGGLQGDNNRPPAAPVAVPRAPDSFQRLAGEYPVLLRPYVIMYKARAAVADYRDNLGYRQRFMEELAKASETGGMSETDEIVIMSRRMTPGQRMRMLRELMAINAPADGARPSDRELMQEMRPAEAAREMIKLNRATEGQ